MEFNPIPSRLVCLPVELLEIIVSSIPEMFQCLNVGFSTVGLERLLKVSKSYLALHVKAISYEASALVDPLASHWGTFRGCLYTPNDFARDQMDMYGVRKSQRLPYSTIFSYFRLRCEEQQHIIRFDQDTRALVASLPYFPNLHAVQLRFTDGIEDRFQSLANRMLLDGHPMFPNHLEKLLTAITVAQENGVTIRTFEISGFYSRVPTEDRSLHQLATEALQKVEKLRLVDSPAMMPFVNRLSLPCLRRLELANCWLSVPALEECIRLRADSLQSLHFENTWILEEEISHEGIHISMGCTKTLLDHLARVPGARRLRLTASR
ncbi:hypothetical protein CNMCM7691_005633 [Aspergillus felis]|uniref:Uncharacterized protein n=1 Tax=Aspergillus felis TaxID=1287682 RepID=A0A8H6QQU0_9EURO|nr:hypothetical protein CNMCM7691_005633 [Aspergillus felis]